MPGKKNKIERDPKINEKILSSFQGGFGEYVAVPKGGEHISLHQTGFNKEYPSEPGFDNILQDSTGKYWIIEAKCTDVNGILALKADEGPDEMTTEWITDRLNRMLNPHDKDGYYKIENVPLAEKLKSIGIENIGRMVVHIHPITFNIVGSNLLAISGNTSRHIGLPKTRGVIGSNYVKQKRTAPIRCIC